MTAGTETATAIGTAKLAGYAGAVAYFETMGDTEQALLCITFCMAIDLITGILKSKKIGKEITSHRWTFGITKKMLVLIVILQLCAVLWVLKIDYHPVFNTLIPMLCMAELYSTLQNVYTFRTGEILPEYDVVSKLIKRATNLVGAALEGFIDKVGGSITGKTPVDDKDRLR